jgi:putative chitinase
MTLTPDQLRLVMPMCPDLAGFAAGLSDAMDKGAIVIPQAQAAFLAQCAYECDQGRQLTEGGGPADWAKYEGRADLGNTQPGDGARYPGRGDIQGTGRGFAEAMTRQFNVDFVNHPELLATQPWCHLAAVYFWNTKTHPDGTTLSFAGEHTDVTFMFRDYVWDHAQHQMVLLPPAPWNGYDVCTRLVNGAATVGYPSYQEIRRRFYVRARQAVGI